MRLCGGGFVLPLCFAVLSLYARGADLYWAGSGGDAATAGSGAWDANNSVDWRVTTPTGSLVKWTDGRTAIFQGTVGGTVAVNSSLSLEGIQFTSASNAFTFAASSGLDFTGTGILNNSTRNQTFNFSLGILTFEGTATAGGGSLGGHVFLSNDGLTTFSASSTAGAATFTNNGEAHFSNLSSAGSAAIINGVNGALTFQDDAVGGTAVITNQGQLTLQDNAANFGSASISNNGGSISLFALTPTNASLGQLTNSGGGTLFLGTTHLAIANLSLTNDNELNFDLGSGVNGLISVTGSILGNTAASGTRISVNDAGGLVSGQTYTLLDWSGAGTVTGVDASDFALQPLPDGVNGQLHVQGKTLVLEVLPEPRDIVCVVLGGVAMLGLMRRRRA